MADGDCCLREVTCDDIALIERYLRKADYEESNHNVLNMMIWLDLFRLQEMHDEDVMILLCTFKNFVFAYMPFCKPEHFAKGMQMIHDLFTCLHLPVALNCYTEEAQAQVKMLYPKYEFQEYTDINDYVYETEKLRTFAGKKLQKKRNHLNAFYKEYEGRYSYEPLDSKNLPDCQDFFDDWKEDTDDEFLRHERMGVERIWEHLEKFDAKGGLIRIDGMVKAFIIGSTLSKRMCQINVEKADDQIRGLYQAILKEFLQRNYLDKEYVNREDDMGKENLRHAKEAYYPVFMVKKYLMNGGKW